MTIRIEFTPDESADTRLLGVIEPGGISTFIAPGPEPDDPEQRRLIVAEYQRIERGVGGAADVYAVSHPWFADWGLQHAFATHQLNPDTHIATIPPGGSFEHDIIEASTRQKGRLALRRALQP